DPTPEPTPDPELVEDIVMEMENFLESSRDEAAFDGDVNDGFLVDGGTISWNTSGDWADYRINFNAVGTWTASISAATPINDDTNVVLYVNDVEVASAPITSTSAWDVYANFDLGNFQINSIGDHDIRIQSRGGSTWQWNADNVTFKFSPPIGEAVKTTAINSGAWSQASTWDNGLPDATKRAIIPQGTTVSLSGTNLNANGVVVQGMLTANEQANADISLSTDWIHVNSMGVFEIGSAANPFDESNFTLTLIGTNPIADWDIETAMGTMAVNDNNSFIMVAGGGRLQFYGDDKLTFTRLSQTASIGSTSIVVRNVIERNYDGTTSSSSDGALNWQVGDQIVIASSSRNYSHEEVRIISAIDDLGDGNSEIEFNESLNYRHYGEQETYGSADNTRTIEMRAEVALLNRNVKIQGLASQDTDTNFGNRENFNVGVIEGDGAGVGGNIMIMGTAGQITLDSVQLNGMGQTGRLGRYPFHWHLAGDRNGDELRGISITNSNNRGITVHGTHNVLIQDVVLHDIHGHGFFMEDAVETGNTFLSNIAFAIHKVGGDSQAEINDPFLVDTHDHAGQNSTRFLNSAGYWMTNPDNTWIGNVSAGSEGTGFWFLFPEKAIGASASDLQYASVQPDRVNFGEFEYNSSHSSPIGLNFDRGSDIEVPVGATLKDTFDGDEYRPNLEPQVYNYTAYKHTTGIYHRARTGNFEKIFFADNFTSSFITFTQRITDSLYVGHSRGNSDLNQIVTGHSFYDGANTLDGTHFAGFTADNAHMLRTESIAIRHTHFVMRNTSFENDGTATSLSFSGPAGKMTSYTPIGKTMPSVLYDEDGTLTASEGGEAGNTVIPDHPFFYNDDDFKPVGWRNARISDDLYAVFRLRATQNPTFRITTATGVQATGNPGTGQFAGTNTLMKLDDGEYAVELTQGNNSASSGFDVLYFAVNGPRTGSTVVQFTNMANDFSVGNRTYVNDLTTLKNASQTSWTRWDGHIYVNFFSVNSEGDRVNFVSL
ncbi:G8 domain-containing protein, partial [Colwellia sp. E2M01]|uniref:G8 domain-containing protein n=1 Tax=Colwellia sp. E2M01 TaxID=2841561 RepID=UPI001C08EA90